MIKTGIRVNVFLVLLMLAPRATAADSYDGIYAVLQNGIEYRLTLEADGFGRYDGILEIDGEKSGIDATRFGDRLAGRIIGPQGQDPVVLELRNRNLLLLSWQDGKTLRLLRDH